MSLKFNPVSGQFDILGVQGPSSSTNLAVAIYNGTTGQLIKNTSVTIDPFGFVNASGFLNNNILTSSSSLDIGPIQQMIVIGPYFIEGTLTVEGQMLVL